MKWYREFTRFVQRKGLRDRSQDCYPGWVWQLADHFPGMQPPRLGQTKVLDFLVHLQADRELGPSTLNQAVCALRTLYRDHLGRDWDIWKKPRPPPATRWTSP